MRIAQIAPLQLAIPPKDYGGTERVIGELTDALVQLGHTATLFATGDSHTQAHLIPFVPKALGFDSPDDTLALQLALLTEVYRCSDEFDVIHSHLEHLTFPFIATTQTPTILTFHSRLDPPARVRLLEAYPNTNYVSISDSQRAPISNVRWAATVYHGIHVHGFRYYAEPENYLAFIGRITPEKRPERAIRIAKQAGIKLKFAAKTDRKDRLYFKQVVEPLLHDPLIEFLGPVYECRKCELIGHARALLLPIDWREPFGMVFIESLASGTLILTRPRGSAPEVVDDGVTGFIRETDEELVAAVRDLPAIDRACCRQVAEQRFDIRHMAQKYVHVYEQMLTCSERTNQYKRPDEATRQT
ncbi:MAG: glycosyltransferase family 4 protein [Ktedonobacterales bacterium]